MTIKQGDVWEVYNTQKTAKREVVVISNDQFNRFSDWHQVIPLDDTNSGRKHPFDVRIRSRNVAVDLISTLPKDFFISKKASALPEEMENVRAALFQLFSSN